MAQQQPPQRPRTPPPEDFPPIKPLDGEAAPAGDEPDDDTDAGDDDDDTKD